MNDELAPFPIGAKVLLRACAVGEPGTVLRVERGKLVVLWHDLDHLARHGLESLITTAAVTSPEPHGWRVSSGQGKGEQA